MERRLEAATIRRFVRSEIATLGATRRVIVLLLDIAQPDPPPLACGVDGLGSLLVLSRTASIRLTDLTISTNRPAARHPHTKRACPSADHLTSSLQAPPCGPATTPQFQERRCDDTDGSLARHSGWQTCRSGPKRQSKRRRPTRPTPHPYPVARRRLERARAAAFRILCQDAVWSANAKFCTRATARPADAAEVKMPVTVPKIVSPLILIAPFARPRRSRQASCAR
jgi:hypothetical protein